MGRVSKIIRSTEREEAKRVSRGNGELEIFERVKIGKHETMMNYRGDTEPGDI